MPTVTTSTPLNLEKKGDLYVCGDGIRSFISTEPAELIEAIAKGEAKSLIDFIGEGTTTWTFVKSDLAQGYDMLVQLMAGQLPANYKTSAFNHSLNLSHLLNQFSQEQKDAVDWIKHNASSSVKAITGVAGNVHYFMFESRDEALLFKLAHGG